MVSEKRKTPATIESPLTSCFPSPGFYLRLTCSDSCVSTISVNCANMRVGDPPSEELLTEFFYSICRRDCVPSDFFSVNHFWVKRYPGHSCGHIGAPSHRPNICLRLTDVAIGYLAQMGLRKSHEVRVLSFQYGLGIHDIYDLFLVVCADCQVYSR